MRQRLGAHDARLHEENAELVHVHEEAGCSDETLQPNADGGDNSSPLFVVALGQVHLLVRISLTDDSLKLTKYQCKYALAKLACRSAKPSCALAPGLSKDASTQNTF